MIEYINYTFAFIVIILLSISVGFALQIWGDYASEKNYSLTGFLAPVVFIVWLIGLIVVGVN
jgi:hypothetical protein